MEAIRRKKKIKSSCIVIDKLDRFKGKEAWSLAVRDKYGNS